MNKPVYIFEEKSQSLDFPIPYLTELILYNPEEERNEVEIERALSEIKSQLLPSPALARGIIGALIGEAPAPGVGGIGGFLSGVTTTHQELRKHSVRVVCPYNNCRISYMLTPWPNIKSFKCPSCRRGVELQ